MAMNSGVESTSERHFYSIESEIFEYSTPNRGFVESYVSIDSSNRILDFVLEYSNIRRI